MFANLFSKKNRSKSVFVVIFLLLMSFAVAAYALTEKTVELVDNGSTVTVKTHAATVGDLLEQKGITLTEKDAVSPAADAELTSGDRVVVSRAFTVAVTADFQTQSYQTQPVTVAEFLQDNGIALGENDWVTPSAASTLQPGDNVTINRITYRETQTIEEIKPQRVRQQDASLNAGQSKVVTAGVPGERVITNLVTYKDGVPINKQELSRVVTRQAQSEVLAVGTRQVISRGGRDYAYTEVKSMRATAYTHSGNRTATGTWPSPGFTVAVDPDVIPLGTMLYVEGYGYAKAEDTGGAIKGNRIDIFLDTKSECRNWGVRTVRVYILD